MMYTKIVGTGRYLPEKILTNFDLEKMVDTSDEWIRTRTGVERRHNPSGHQSHNQVVPATLSLAAAHPALQSRVVVADRSTSLALSQAESDECSPPLSITLGLKYCEPSSAPMS